MRPVTKIIITTLVVGAMAFVLASLIWSPPSGGPQPTTLQLILLIGASGVDAIFFGLGAALIWFGWSLFRRVRPRKGNADLAFISLVWIIISWLPHSGFHKAVGDSISGLIAIEYGFHATVMLAGTYLAYFLLVNSISSDPAS